MHSQPSATAVPQSLQPAPAAPATRVPPMDKSKALKKLMARQRAGGVRKGRGLAAYLMGIAERARLTAPDMDDEDGSSDGGDDDMTLRRHPAISGHIVRAVPTLRQRLPQEYSDDEDEEEYHIIGSSRQRAPTSPMSARKVVQIRSRNDRSRSPRHSSRKPGRHGTPRSSKATSSKNRTPLRLAADSSRPKGAKHDRSNTRAKVAPELYVSKYVDLSFSTPSMVTTVAGLPDDPTMTLASSALANEHHRGGRLGSDVAFAIIEFCVPFPDVSSQNRAYRSMLIHWSLKDADYRAPRSRTSRAWRPVPTYITLNVAATHRAVFKDPRIPPAVAPPRSFAIRNSAVQRMIGPAHASVASAAFGAAASRGGLDWSRRIRVADEDEEEEEDEQVAVEDQDQLQQEHLAPDEQEEQEEDEQEVKAPESEPEPQEQPALKSILKKANSRRATSARRATSRPVLLTRQSTLTVSRDSAADCGIDSPHTAPIDMASPRSPQTPIRASMSARRLTKRRTMRGQLSRSNLRKSRAFTKLMSDMKRAQDSDEASPERVMQQVKRKTLRERRVTRVAQSMPEEEQQKASSPPPSDDRRGRRRPVLNSRRQRHIAEAEEEAAAAAVVAAARSTLRPPTPLRRLGRTHRVATVQQLRVDIQIRVHRAPVGALAACAKVLLVSPHRQLHTRTLHLQQHLATAASVVTARRQAVSLRATLLTLAQRLPRSLGAVVALRAVIVFFWFFFVVLHHNRDLSRLHGCHSSPLDFFPTLLQLRDARALFLHLLVLQHE
eukprot:TRINITY_DN66313_c5_g1_i3.p1 TRINITY_DN66313_c5_g1~~TRINITY_DN66313_c5_g1_i3.p1  ORF type:complete len:777 (+),score=265.78 TRINITY_DN66313_c5_g1_i3:968-3298(+)